jgi:hypothetical protein
MGTTRPEEAPEDEVTDRDLQDEIILLGDVIAAAAGATTYLSPADLDLALGVRPPAPTSPVAQACGTHPQGSVRATARHALAGGTAGAGAGR